MKKTINKKKYKHKYNYPKKFLTIDGKIKKNFTKQAAQWRIQNNKNKKLTNKKISDGVKKYHTKCRKCLEITKKTQNYLLSQQNN